MESRSLRDTRAHLAAIIEAVENGESFQITKHGKVVALLVPADRKVLTELKGKPPADAPKVGGPFPAVKEEVIDRPLTAKQQQATRDAWLNAINRRKS